MGTLPFDWARYDFMNNAFLAVLFFAPLLALIGTVVVSQKMAFFSDVLGHSALAGIGLGVVMGAPNPIWAMLVFMVILAVSIGFFREATKASIDTVLGVFFGVVVALGVVILSRGGGFAKYTIYLIGDILTVTPLQIRLLAVIFVAVLIYWLLASNSLFLISVNPVLAHSRRVPVWLVQTSFAILLAVVVALSIRLIGILMINSLLILPAAAARNLARNVRAYTFWALGISLASGIGGLIVSFYGGTAAGATIVLFAAVFYGLSLMIYLWKNRRRQAVRRAPHPCSCQQARENSGSDL